MCGLFGISYGPEGQEAEEWSPTDFMQMMFPAIAHRGPHAYGWMWYDGEEIHVRKYKGRADTPEALQTMFIEGPVKWFVAHVRHYTHGTPDLMANNHPILHGNIIGAHNGIITNYQEILDETGREDEAAEVDSEAIFAAINKWGHIKGLKKIKGDMVAIYANRENPNILHIARTHRRPLVLCSTPAGSKVFASEEKVINATGIAHAAYSNLSMWRLIRIREGKIFRRITLTDNSDPVAAKLKDPQRWNRDGHRGRLGNHIPDWLSEVNERNAYQGALRGRGTIPAPNPSPSGTVTRRTDHSGLSEQAARLRRAAADPRSRNLKDHDKFGEFYYLSGILLTEQAYLETIADMTEGDQ